MFRTMRPDAVRIIDVIVVALVWSCSGQPSTNTCGNSVGGSVSSDSCLGTGGAGTGGSASTGGQATGGAHTTLPFPTLDFTCVTDADCCVVEYACFNTLYLVTKTQEAQMQAYVASLSTPYCTACITPEVQVSCQNKQCTGQVVGVGTWPSTGLSATHCGVLPVLGAAGASSSDIEPALAVTAASDAGTSPKTVFGCGTQ